MTIPSCVEYNADMRTGLYVHVPFCETKCGYCDFYSVPLGDRATAPLVRAIVAELEQRESSVTGPFQTIFVGGGTPTLLPLHDMKTLFGRLADIAQRDQVIEFTTEANPATVDDEKADILRRHGVTRVSMGAQSFLPEELATLERLHSPRDIAPSVRTLRRWLLGSAHASPSWTSTSSGSDTSTM